MPNFLYFTRNNSMNYPHMHKFNTKYLLLIIFNSEKVFDNSTDLSNFYKNYRYLETCQTV